jgi:hypothetical protein
MLDEVVKSWFMLLRGIVSATNLSSLEVVGPVKTGVRGLYDYLSRLDSGFYRNDYERYSPTFWETIMFDKGDFQP